MIWYLREASVFVVQCTGVISQKLSKNDGNSQITYSSFNALILILIMQMNNIIYVLVKT